MTPPETKVRLGVLTNPSAQHNERFPYTHRNLEKHLDSMSDAVVTASAAECDAAVRHLLVERGVNVLGINGGDGTIHSTLAAIIDLKRIDPSIPMPTLLLLNGGTYNIASRAMRTNHNPADTLRRFKARWADAPLACVSTRELALLQVTPTGSDAHGPIPGMVFGSQVIANVLDLCDGIGGGYIGFSEFLARGVAGYAFKTRFFNSNKWRLQHTADRIQVDGVSEHGTVGVVASTIDLKLARGLVWAISATDPADGFHSKTIRAMNPSDVVRLIPYLMWEFPHPMIVARPHTRTIQTSGPFTLDGELYPDMGPIDVSMGDWRFDVVAGEDI
ncbi:MAG TPA: diacylglycerol kinase family protein [Myxococcota bacterium]|nr:hypothetical protein [Myxococcota bacterium]HNZ02537.1 diacylglycerol kinase family protein [Myxococcota bacterium]HOD06495.1 diacylglycerol kinase family protein [Myxococcota bacterium]HPB49903.1 diacylglycerol kinase family protein [Myxococcota bacterium]HQP94958.1 diacylglycerol kinase family protein [Myxococcota bacterium]